MCPQGWPCVVVCDGKDACKGSTVYCSDGPCELQCSDRQSCDGLVLMCGVHSCNAWCSDDEASVEQVECGASCECQTNCPQGDAGDTSDTSEEGPTEGGGSSD